MSAKRAAPSLFAPEELPDNLAPWEIAEQADRWYGAIVFSLPLTTVFHYEVPNELREMLRPGCRVEAPFGRGNQAKTGYCVGVSREAPTSRAIKPLTALLDREPLLDAHLLELTRWIADRYLCGWGQVLDSIIPAGVKAGSGTREIQFYTAAPDAAARLLSSKLPPKQKAVVQVLLDRNAAMAIGELTAAADCGPGPIQTLRQKGWIIADRRRTMVAQFDAGPVEAHTAIQLNLEQQRVVDTVLAALRKQQHQTFLLHGVTGSGKTEVYIRTIEEVVSYGRQAIVLVPEISLTPQTIRRFRSRFSSVAVLHSHLTDAERHAQWKLIAEGQVQVVVGARSAVFAPTPHLGLIVIDEEHETSFKQDNTPRYHAREVARQRAVSLNVPLLLGTATPTLESWLRVQRREDALLSLPRRVARLPLPPVVIVDTRNDPLIQNQQRAIGRALFTAMQQTLRSDGQMILFLNVRGFSPLMLCRGCGNSLRCPDCDLTLTWHKQHCKALCHGCGHEIPPPTVCPKCQRPGMQVVGIGTERLEHEVRTLFPNVASLRMDSDTMKARGSHHDALERFRHGDVRILLGTQMIAKGLDFPNVTLVGVVDADTSLRQPDLRARERTFQLIAQVAGRTGRSAKGGRVLVQTACPDDPAIQFAARHDYLGFAKLELEERAAVHAPPFRQAVRIIVRGFVEALVQAESERLVDRLREAAPKSVRVLGPAPCPIARLQKYFRFHLQMTSEDREALRTVWLTVAPNFAPAKDVEIAVDVDPLNLR